jgi:sigma-B regulation protein RsbU (phosphoserine phosphatase)
MHDNILIAEHDVVSRTRLKAILQGLGHTPRVFDDGWEAWYAFEEQPARIVFCDWQAPGLDGVGFCNRIRSQPNSEYTFFIMVTAASTPPEEYTKAITADVDDFLVKPLRRDAIWRRLQVARRTLQFTHHIQNLERLLPICLHCKRIRTSESHGLDSKWQRIEEYIDERAGTKFTPRVCPDCLVRVNLT